MTELVIEMKDMTVKEEVEEKVYKNESPTSVIAVEPPEVSAPPSPIPEPPEDTGTLTGKQVLFLKNFKIAGNQLNEMYCRYWISGDSLWYVECTFLSFDFIFRSVFF